MLIELREGEVLNVPSAASSRPSAPPRTPSSRPITPRIPMNLPRPNSASCAIVLIDRSRFDAQAVPSDADLASAYKDRAAGYAARESRDFNQLIVPTEAQAKDFVARPPCGKSLVDLAREAGLSASHLTDLNQVGLAAQAGQEAAKAAFAAPKGEAGRPVQGGAWLVAGPRRKCAKHSGQDAGGSQASS